MLWYLNVSFIFDFIVFVPVIGSMFIWKNLTIYWWLAHRTFILQGCDASKCCPPSFAKNGNGQLPFNRWRLLVVIFNRLTFAHLLQLFEQHFPSGLVTAAVKWVLLIFVGALLLYRSTAPCLVYRSELWRMAPIFRNKAFMTQPFCRIKGEAHLIWHFCRLRLSFKWSPPPQLGRRFSRLVLHSKGSQYHLVFKLLFWIFTAFHRAASEDLRTEAASSIPPLRRTMRRILHWWEIWWRGWSSPLMKFDDLWWSLTMWRKTPSWRKSWHLVDRRPFAVRHQTNNMQHCFHWFIFHTLLCDFDNFVMLQVGKSRSVRVIAKQSNV